MREKILFSTANPNKVKEVNQLLGFNYEVITPKDIGFSEDVEETGGTFMANAKLKTEALVSHTNHPIFSEDTGLLVKALNDEPGVRTARYAGENADAQSNMNLLLKNLEGVVDRKAYFRTVICLWWKKEFYFFTGECHGTISVEKRGSQGFGYDPIFVPDGYNESFAQLGDDIKKKLSHRAKAVHKLVDFLKTAKA